MLNSNTAFKVTTYIDVLIIIIIIIIYFDYHVLVNKVDWSITTVCVQKKRPNVIFT